MWRRIAWELVLAFIVCTTATVWYAGLSADGTPAPGGMIGHSLGIVGFSLMLITEFAYTLRKRMKRYTLWPTSVWLQAHVFTGLVGPWLVLLHSSGKFHGLAGVVSLLTVLMVVSGFIGRFLYTATPRSLGGAELTAEELREKLIAVERAMQSLPEDVRKRLSPGTLPRAWIAVLTRWYLKLRYRQKLQATIASLPAEVAKAVRPLKEPLLERFDLVMQMHALLAARRLLAWWHVLHVPLGGVLFGLAFLHVGAAMYYSTFLR